ncbi:MAG TPA: ABC transporter ATP-binding protein [Herpetosiphonaceae bacterium]
MSGPVAITIDHLTVRYLAGAAPVVALQDLSCRIDGGTFIALVGPSGCGKSTLLRTLGGLVAPTAGRIAIGGASPDEARAARRVSFVFQQPVLLPWYTARQNIELPLRLFGWPSPRRHAAAAQFLDLVGLTRFADSYPSQLSGGMQQRVALARALAFEPAVLLLDEPFGALDEITRERLNVELLRIWSATQATVLFVTHSLAEAAFLADRVLVLATQPGRIVADVPIALPRPRTAALLEQDAFLHTVAGLRRQFNRRDPQLTQAGGRYE